MYSETRKRVGVLNRQIKELVGAYRDAIRCLDIAESEFWIWYTLVVIGGEYTQQDICAVWSLPKQTVNTVITRMRLKKHAYLEAVAGTRNHKLVRLTSEGRAYGESIVLPILHAEERAFECISGEELSLAVSIFDRYLDAIKSALKSGGNDTAPRSLQKGE